MSFMEIDSIKIGLFLFQFFIVMSPAEFELRSTTFANWSIVCNRWTSGNNLF